VDYPWLTARLRVVTRTAVNGGIRIDQSVFPQHRGLQHPPPPPPPLFFFFFFFFFFFSPPHPPPPPPPPPLLIGGLFITALMVAYIRGAGLLPSAWRGQHISRSRTHSSMPSRERVMEAKRALRGGAEQHVQAMLSSIAEGRLMIATALCDIYGLAPSQVVPGRTIPELLEMGIISARFRRRARPYLRRLRAAVAQGRSFQEQAETAGTGHHRPREPPDARRRWVATHRILTSAGAPKPRSPTWLAPRCVERSAEKGEGR